MLILALESSAKPASVAICTNTELLGQYFQNSGLTHSRTLLSMTDSLLSNLDIPMSDIDMVAVSHGPGSFTGIRIGVSAAKGLAWGFDIPVCGVSTLEAMVYQEPVPGLLLCPVMDARRDQVYNAFFEWRDGAPKRICDDRAISLEGLRHELQILADSTDFRATYLTPAGQNSDSPDSGYGSKQPVLLTGDGASICYDYLSKAGVNCLIAPGMLRYQTAYGVALASVNTTPVSASELEPCYLRPSQAERERSNAADT